VRDRSRNWLRRLLVPAVGGLAVTASLGMTLMQLTGPSSPVGVNPWPAGRDRGTGDAPYLNPEIQERQLKRLREEHQKELANDTVRLLQMATALKAEVDKGTKDLLTADVIKQADEIGKLAKRVSDRIKTQ
jgi:hypothetical protein